MTPRLRSVTALTTHALHKKAMRASDRALDARRAGASTGEYRQLLRALRLELRAAGMAAERGVAVETLKVLTFSAYNLAFRVHELQTRKSQ